MKHQKKKTAKRSIWRLGTGTTDIEIQHRQVPVPLFKSLIIFVRLDYLKYYFPSQKPQHREDPLFLPDAWAIYDDFPTGIFSTQKQSRVPAVCRPGHGDSTEGETTWGWVNYPPMPKGQGKSTCKVLAYSASFLQKKVKTWDEYETGRTILLLRYGVQIIAASSSLKLWLGVRDRSDCIEGRESRNPTSNFHVSSMIHGMKKGTPVAQQRLCPDGGTRDSAKASIRWTEMEWGQMGNGRKPSTHSCLWHPGHNSDLDTLGQMNNLRLRHTRHNPKFGRPPISFSDTLHPSFSLAFCYALLSLQASHPLHPLGHFYLQRDPVDLQDIHITARGLFMNLSIQRVSFVHTVDGQSCLWHAEKEADRPPTMETMQAASPPHQLWSNTSRDCSTSEATSLQSGSRPCRVSGLTCLAPKLPASDKSLICLTQILQQKPDGGRERQTWEDDFKAQKPPANTIDARHFNLPDQATLPNISYAVNSILLVALNLAVLSCRASRIAESHGRNL
ncbi:uncharacterized protein CLUP02_18085 [Colletotrichum lupini]|uniref:Uncharacterized protein n=1 Tax=Colletotrichum lupini TaxID=145971 RepID=A0A9Q8SFR6_9PEZI|nr:uncharacterized protein CLUP02_18085 [Colletotrichum lupini]UQC76572.1 hypothetical protein CLUP02_18085 [Colletotrichum lupini]